MLHVIVADGFVGNVMLKRLRQPLVPLSIYKAGSIQFVDSENACWYIVKIQTK
ncbi:hypothetical protein WwAna0724 [Wolbachia endosymbiont of Drosophila ananassae]|nr:hypothetical protein WwAna0724 [Wolbachia endosymbiont of Drosophila ananassae]